MSLSNNQEQKIRQMQPLIMLGMHRSGTSLLVRLLSDLGIHMGSWLSRDAESIHFLGLNKRIYNAAGSNWGVVDPLIESIASDPFVEQQSNLMHRALFVDKLSDFIKHFNPILQAEAIRLVLSDDTRFVLQNPLIAVFFGQQLWEKVSREETFPWGWKDPRTTLTFPIWLRIFPNARFLHVLRNGIDVAISTHRRSQKQQRKFYKRLFPIDYSPETMDFGYCFRLWEKYIDFVMDHRQLILPDRFFEIRYEDLLSDPVEQMRKVTDFLEYHVEESSLLTVCEQIDSGRLDNSVLAQPYQYEIMVHAKSPLMKHLGYRYHMTW